MADIIGQETWTADGKSYVIKVTEPGATVTENAISIISPIRLRGGDPNYDPLEPILETQLEFTIRDTSNNFRTAIAGKQVGDIVLEFTEDGTTIFKGYVVPEFRRRLIYQSNPTYQVSAFDGVSLLKGFFYEQAGFQTVRDQIYNISDKVGLSLTLNQIFETKELVAKAATEAPDAMRFRVENLQEEGSYYDALTTLCEYYNAQFFQSGGEWWFMQRLERGADVTKRPTNSAGTAQTAVTADLIYDLTNDKAHREKTFFFDLPPKSRIESTHVIEEYLLRNSCFNEGSRHWAPESGTLSSGKWEISTHADYIEQELGTTFRKIDGTLEYIKFEVEFEIDVNASASGTGVIRWAEVFAEDESGNKRWLDNDSTWSSSQVWLEYGGVDLTANAGGTVSITDANEASLVFSHDVMRVTLRLPHYDGSEAANPNQIIDATRYDSVRVAVNRPDPDDDVLRSESITYTQETGEIGEEIKHSFSIGDANDVYMAPGIIEYYAITDAWVPSNSWSVSGRTFHEDRIIDRHDQVDERLEALEVSHKYGEDVSLHNAIGYDYTGGTSAVVYVPTFVEKIYERNAKVKVRTSSIELLDASTVTPPSSGLDKINHIKFQNHNLLDDA